MSTDTERRHSRAIASVLTMLLASVFLAFTSGAQATTLPSIKIGTAALITPDVADGYYGTNTTSTDGLSALTGTETPTPPEIVDLARALKHNPDLIYQYVRNNIQNVWTYGLAKGALGAEIDKAGSPYDQAELMVALLRQSGYSASYVASTITLTQSQFYSWTGITNALAACQLLSSGGFPAIINGVVVVGTKGIACSSLNPDDSVSSVQLAHIWVQVTITGSGCSTGSDVCAFDPSYKGYTWKSGIPLATAMVFTPGDPLSKAETGSTSGTDPSGAPWVKTLNTSQLDTALAGYGSNLQSYIQSNNLGGAHIEDIVGGGVILPDLSIVRQANLPYADAHPDFIHIWTPGSDTARYNAIPDQYRTTLQTQGFVATYDSTCTSLVDNPMFNATFFPDEIYGRKLTVDTDFTDAGIANHQPNYYDNRITVELDGSPLANVPTYVNTTGGCSSSSLTARQFPAHITLTANHPYAASADGSVNIGGDYMDALIDKPVVLITSLTIVHAWGDVSPELFNKWSNERAADDPLPHRILPPFCRVGPFECPSNYEQSTGNFGREKTAASWLAQVTRAAQLNAAIANAVPQLHHMLGFVYSDAQILAVYQHQIDPQTPPDFQMNDSFDRIDIDSGISMTSKVADASARRAAIQSFAASSAALEGSISGQQSDLPDTSSTISRFEWGNAPPVDAHQNPRTLGPQPFYQFNSTDVSAAAGLITSEGYVVDLPNPSATQCPNLDGTAAWTDQPTISQPECIRWGSTLNDELTAYATAGFSIVTSNESFLGPGQRGGGILPDKTTGEEPDTYMHFASKQRGGAFVATQYDTNGDPLQIAHIIVGLAEFDLGGQVVTKGGGGGTTPDAQQNYNPSDAADILKSRFVDRSNALGVNLSNGSLGFSSPASLKVGNGGFPYELDASLEWQPGPPNSALFGPISLVDPQPGWKMSWLNKLAISGSGLEAMGRSDIRAAIGTIVAFYAAQDIYKASPSVQRDVAGPLALAWWSHQLVGNVATVSMGASSRQFVQLYNNQWILPGPDFATLTQTGSRVPYEQSCPHPNDSPYPGSRGWDYSGMSFQVANKGGDVENFGYWMFKYATNDQAVCGQLNGFRLTSWTFPYGMTITPVYTNTTGFGELSEVDNSAGRKLILSSNPLSTITNGLSGSDARSMSVAAPAGYGNIPSMTDPMGETTTFNYQTPVVTSPTTRPIPYSLLTQVFTPDNPTEANVEYGYDKEARVMSVKDAVAIQVGGRNPYYFYIADGTRGERVDPLGQSYGVLYDTYGHPAAYDDEVGNFTAAQFDGRARPVSYTYPEGDCDVFAYDDTGTNHNNVTDLWHVDMASACATGTGAGHVLHTSATWDPTWNKPLTVTNPRGFATTLTYYASGNGASLLDTATRPTITEGTPVYSFTYDTKGKTLTSVVPFTSTQTITTANTFDPVTESLLTSTLDPGTSPHVNATTSFTYDAQGDVATTTDPRGNVTSSFFDLDRRKTEDDHHNGNVSATLNAADRTIYDAIGRDIRDDAGKTFSGTTVTVWTPVKTTTYTPTSKVATVTDADGSTTTTLYDDADRTLTVTDPVSRSTHFVYCAPGDTNCAANQVKIELRAWAGSNNNCSVTGTLQQCYRTVNYFPDGEQRTIADANGNTTTYGYDPFIRLTTTTFPDTSYEQLTLDENGNVTSRKNRAGQTLTYTYNTLDWALSKVSLSPAVTTTWTYMLNGAIGTLSDTASNAIQNGFDPAGRVTSVSTAIPGIVGALTSSYMLDKNGNRTQLTWPDSYAVNYTYDNLNRMLTAADSGLTLATYNYDYLSRRTLLTYGNGASIAYTYSDAGDLKVLSHDFTGTSNDVTFTNTFTAAHQLNSEAVSNSAYQWQPTTLATTPYATANNLNQYPSVNGVTFSYDAKGNLTSDGVNTYTYDAENRLLTAGTFVGYSYDPLGRRTTKSASAAPLWGTVNWGSFTWTAGAPTYYLSDGSDEIAEYNGSGAVTTRYVPGPAIDEPIAMVTASGTHTYFHANHQGSIIGMSDASGNLIEGPYTYDPYGNCFLGASSTPCSPTGEPYRFTGQRLDPETGLYYYRARYYGAGIGRFYQTDPVGYKADLNLYTYGGNDPTNNSDPSGKSDVGRELQQELMRKYNSRAQMIEAAMQVTHEAKTVKNTVVKGAKSAAKATAAAAKVAGGVAANGAHGTVSLGGGATLAGGDSKGGSLGLVLSVPGLSGGKGGIDVVQGDDQGQEAGGELSVSGSITLGSGPAQLNGNSTTYSGQGIPTTIPGVTVGPIVSVGSNGSADVGISGGLGENVGITDTNTKCLFGTDC